MARPFCAPGSEGKDECVWTRDVHMRVIEDVIVRVRSCMVCLFLATLINSAQAFSGIIITGRVIDHVSREGLPYASITLINSYTGTAANSQGFFAMLLDSGKHRLQISQVGYQSEIIETEETSYDLVIELVATAVEMDAMEVYAYNWMDGFILDAIGAKNALNRNILHYTAYTYSKTVFKFPPPRNDIFGMWESLSKISYVFPDKYQEYLLHLHSPPQFRNFPYKYVAINQRINLHQSHIDINTLSIVSPIADDALEYYTYTVSHQYFDGADTAIVVEVTPKATNTPLFRGRLTFNKAKRTLLEAELMGNEFTHSPTTDSISIIQKYALHDATYNVPTFTKCSFRINYLGMLFYYIQEYASVDFDINDPVNIPTILERGNSVIPDPRMTYDVALPRDTVFHMVLTQEEKLYKQHEEEIINAPFYKKAILYVLVDILPLALDEQAEIAGLTISRLSNWYHFNKVEGHFLGFEFLPINSDIMSLHFRGGWSSGNKWLTAAARGRYKNIVVGYERAIQTLGRVDINRSLTSIDASLSHVDNIYYYASEQWRLSLSREVASHTSVAADLVLEKQRGVDNTTEFSVFSKDKVYSKNVRIEDYRNNYAAVTFTYDDDGMPLEGERIAIVGKSYVNVSTGMAVSHPRLLQSTEQSWEWFASVRTIQAIHRPVSIDVSVVSKYQTGSSYVQKMNFLSSSRALREHSHPLSFYSISNYDYYCESYLRVRSAVVLLSLPTILHFRPSIGAIVSYLRPSGNHDFEGFTRLKNDFWEYGISLRGISFLNVHVVKNNLDEAVHVALDFTL